MTNEQAKEIGKILDRIKRKKGFEYAPTVQELQELLQQEYIEKKAEEMFPYKKTRTDYATDECRKIYKTGYNQALEDNKDRIKNILMEYDLMVKKHLLMYSIEHSIHGKICEGLSDVRNEYIQSLQPPTSWDVTIVDGKFKLV